MKKLFALLLAAALTLSLTACGNTPASSAPAAASAPASTAAPATPAEGGLELSGDGRYPKETVKIGFINYDTSAAQVVSIQDYYKYLQTAFNFEMIWSESLKSSEEELAFIEQCAAAGCKAVIGYYNEAKEESVKLATSLGMVYWGPGDGKAFYEKVSDNPLYAGGYFAEQDQNYAAGYAIVENLVAQGSKKLIIMSGGKDFGVEFFANRYEGMMAALEDAKKAGKEVEVVYEVPGWPGTEEFAAHQTAALQTDADGLAGSLTALMWIQPMQTAGKMGQIKVGAVDTASKDLVGLMQGGVYSVVAAEASSRFGMAIPMIFNMLDGHSKNMQTADGKAAIVDYKDLVITTPDQMEFYAATESKDGTWIFSTDDLKTIMGAYNPDFTLDDMSKLYTAVSVEEVKARHGA